MNGRELFTRLQEFGDIDPSEASVIGWIDQAQKKASLDLPVVQEITVINVESGTVLSIPTGVFRILSATTGDNDYPRAAIKIKSDGLVFLKSADLVTIVYTSIAPKYTSLDEELTIHPSLHAPLVYFLISMYYDVEGEGDEEESGLAERFYQRWVYYRNLAIAKINNSENETNDMEPIPTLDVLPKSRKVWGDDYYE